MSIDWPDVCRFGMTSVEMPSDAVELDHNTSTGIGQIDLADECSRSIMNPILEDGSRQAVPLEQMGHHSAPSDARNLRGGIPRIGLPKRACDRE